MTATPTEAGLKIKRGGKPFVFEPRVRLTALPAKHYGEGIRRCRTHRGLSQSALADHIGVSSTSIGQWEKGHSSVNIQDLCMILDVLEITLPQFWQMVPGAHEKF